VGKLPRQGPGRGHAQHHVLACRWLTGELDGQVVLPVSLVCAALNLDPVVLAAAVRTRTAR
jgi:hypothetical protein